MKIAFQGEAGAFSEIAAKKFFKEKIESLPSYSFNDVFSKVKKGTADFGVVPIENTLYGAIFETYDLLLKYSLTIVGEINLQINHYLLAKKNYKLNQIKKVYSHPQALGQCSGFLSKLKNTKIIPAYDTAGSAELSMQENDVPSAAIASKEAAEIYKMKILGRDIQNNKENYTRFLIISKKNNHKKMKKNDKEFANPKSSICFELKNIPGALYKALSVFALREIDLTKIESRPIPHKPFQYMFYVDLIGDLKEKKIIHSLNELEDFALTVKKFGTYEIGKTYKS